MKHPISIISVVLLLTFVSGVNAAGCQGFNDCKVKAEQGDVQSQASLGWMYDKGKGVSQDYEKAVYWYQKAADQGDANGQLNLGLMYDKGRGVEQDYEKAVYWYQKAADQGDEDAQKAISRLYAEGKVG
jgi:TPR repeat protein